MTLPRRTLTINFQRSVTAAGVPNTIEVAVAPLSEPSAPGPNITLVGGTQTQVVLLDDDITPVVFELVPTDAAGLSERVLYRIAWRERYLGRQYVKDFVMPDSDVAFADLEDLGAIIGGETYIPWSERGQAGGVAGLNELGQVLDGDGNALIIPGIGEALNLARVWFGPVVPSLGNTGTVSHGLETQQVIATFRRSDTRQSVDASWRPATNNLVEVTFSSPPDVGEYWAVVIG